MFFLIFLQLFELRQYLSLLTYAHTCKVLSNYQFATKVCEQKQYCVTFQKFLQLWK